MLTDHPVQGSPSTGASGGGSRCLLIGVLLVALVARLTVALATQSWNFPAKDDYWSFGHEMGRIARSLAIGKGFASHSKTQETGPTAWMPPVYPFLMGGVFAVFGPYSTTSALVLEGLQTLLALVSCALLYRIGNRLFAPSVGLLAALMLAVYPPALHFSVQKIWSTYLFVFCLLLTLVQIWSLAHKPSWPQSLLTGVGFGFTSLVDPVFFAFWPFALLWFGWRGRADWRVRLQYGAGVVLMLAATLSPWLIRNYMVFDRFVFIKSNVGYILWAVNTSPSSAKAEYAEVQGADEGRREHFYQQAFRHIWQQPWPFVHGVLQRGVDFWTLTKTKGRVAGVVTRIAFLLLVVAGLAGLVLSLGKGHEVELLILAVLTLPLPYYLLVFNHLRCRFPVEVLLMIFAGYAMVRMIRPALHAVPRLVVF